MSSRRAALDGAALAVLLAIVFAAGVFDAARANIQSAKLVPPGWLDWAWMALALAGGALGLYVAFRFVSIARQLERGEDGPVLAWLRRRTSWFAFAALGLWLVWQALGIAVVRGHYGIPGELLFGLHWVTVVLMVVAVSLGGAVVGDVALALERRPLVRLQLVFLLVLYIVVFHAPFLSDQMIDVLRGWGDGPFGPAVSRPLGGLAAALLLGAVVRASADRVLLPRAAEPRGLNRHVMNVTDTVSQLRPKPIPWALAGAGVLLISPQSFAGLGIALIIIAAVAWATAATAAPTWPDETDHVVGLRRLTGTIGVVPIAILLGGLVEASINTLLLPASSTASDWRLYVWTAVAIAAFGALAVLAHRRHASADNDDVPGEAAGVFAFGAALLSLADPVASAIVLAIGAIFLAVGGAGDRGAVELWAAWGAALGLAVAVYLDPVGVPRGLGGFAVALIGAAAILALLHPLASLGARRRFRWSEKRRAPVQAAIVLWLLLAWWFAPVSRNQVPTVADAQPPASLSDAVGVWLQDQVDHPVPDRPYVPMLLVAASGGGSKAAYWTDLVLDCAFGDPVMARPADECPGSDHAGSRYRSLFLTSSASGGSVGVYHLIRHADQVGGARDWIANSAGKEVLSPLLAWGLFHDLPALAIGAPTDPTRCRDPLSCPFDADRAAIQAAAAGPAAGGLRTQTGPLTLFNTAQVPRRDPFPLFPRRRVVLSRVALAEPRPGCAASEPIRDAIDGDDLLAAGQDLALGTSAFLSARFPFLEPPGRLGWRSEPSDRGCGGTPPTEQAAKLRDGGTYENTGMLTLRDVLPAIQDAIKTWKREHRQTIDVKLIVLSIDDDVPAIAGGEEYDLQGSAPHTPAGRAKAARRDVCAMPDVDYMRISPQPHLGAQAVTGWEVSETSRRSDLVDSLRPEAGPGKRVQQMRAVLDGTPLPQKCLN